MNTRIFIKKASLAFAGVIAGLAASTAVVSAIPYDAAQTNSSPTPAFNVFTGVPSYGDESDFLRSREVKTEVTQYVDPLNATCNAGDKIQMRVYIHNGASKDANNNGTGPSVAKDVRVKVSLPSTAGATFSPTASISASNAATVNDTSSINCNGKNVKLKYVAGSAAQSSIGTGRVALSDEIVTAGVPIRSQAMDGAVYGCWDERVYVILTVQVEEVVVPKVEPKPVTAVCDTFRIVAGDNRTVRVSLFKFTATNATYKNTVINWDAGKTNVSSAAITDANKVEGQTYKYAADGTYLINATIYFATETDSNLAASTQNCQQQVTFTNRNELPIVVTTTTPAAPVKPVALVAAGPASTIATFAAVAATIGGAYYWSIRRRLV